MPYRPGLCARHFFDRDGAFARGLVHFDELAGRGPRTRNDHVAEQYGERLVTHQFFRDKHGVPESQWLLLPRIAEVHHVADVVHHFGKFGLSLAFQETFQFRRRIEMVFDGVLATAGDDDNVFDPGSDAFLDDVLD